MLVVSLSSLTASPPGAPLPDPKALAKQLAKSSCVANGRPVALETDYLVKGLLTRNEVSVLYGPSNCGKSTLATTMGMAIIHGRPFAGMSTRRTAVLHIAPEGATSVQAATIPYIGKGQSVDAEFYIVLPLRIDLRDKLHAETLVELVRCLEERFDCDIGLIVIDTFVLSIGDADENSSRDVTAAMFNATRIANMTHAHVMCLHHTNKGGDLRGSSAILAASDTTLELAMAKDENDRPIARLRQVKQKTVPKGSDICFRLRSHVLGIDSEGDPRTTAVIDVLPRGTGTVAPREKSKGQGSSVDARQKAVLAAVTALSTDPVAAGAGFEASAIRDCCDRTAFAGCFENLGSFLKAVSRVLDALSGAEGRMIVKEHGRYRLINHVGPRLVGEAAGPEAA